MQITKDIAIFPDNYHSCLSDLQLVANRIVHSVETTLTCTGQSGLDRVHNTIGHKLKV